jgi:hypothetical protein
VNPTGFIATGFRVEAKCREAQSRSRRISMVVENDSVFGQKLVCGCAESDDPV